MMHPSIPIPQAAIEAFCRRWNIEGLSFFGSVLRDDFTTDSDIDVLVRLNPASRTTLFDMVRMQHELEQIFGRKVDLISQRGLESSRNSIRKKAILESASLIYGT